MTGSIVEQTIQGVRKISVVRYDYNNFMSSKVEQGSRRRAEELFDQVKTGDQIAFEQLFAIFFARLNDFASKVVNDDMVSQDIVQDAFIKLWENRNTIQSVNLESFLFLAVRHRCLDFIRHLKVVQNKMERMSIDARYEELYRIDFIGNEPYVLIERELEQRIEFTINQLPERCREVFILSRIQGFKNREIADQLQISIKNVERHLSKALLVFKKEFSGGIPVSLLVLVLKNI